MSAGISAKTEVNARKETYQKEGALELVAKASKLFVAKGKKQIQVDLKKDPIDEAELLKLILGPTGNLRAPTLMVGKTMVVGFNDEMYSAVFG